MIANTLALGLAEIATITAPTSLLISQLQFAQTLYADQQANFDMLTSDGILTKLQTLLQSSAMGGAKGSIKLYLSQLDTAKNLIAAATKRFS